MSHRLNLKSILPVSAPAVHECYAVNKNEKHARQEGNRRGARNRRAAEEAPRRRHTLQAECTQDTLTAGLDAMPLSERQRKGK